MEQHTSWSSVQRWGRFSENWTLFPVLDIPERKSHGAEITSIRDTLTTLHNKLGVLPLKIEADLRLQPSDPLLGWHVLVYDNLRPGILDTE